MDVVETVDLTKIYAARQIALNSVNVSIPQGCIFGLIGPNGAGKSTALRLIMGLQRPTAGSIRVFQEPMNLAAGHLRRRIGFLSQNGNFPFDMSPISYLDLVGKLFGIVPSIRKPRLSALLHAMDLLQASSQRIEHLSSGQRTRLGIAAALMNDPDLLLLDEPTIGLDPEGRHYTLDLFEELRRKGKTIILSTHILPDADETCDFVGILNHGKLVFTGSVLDMKHLTLANTIDLLVEGEVELGLQAATVEVRGITFERLGANTVRIAFNNREGEFITILSQVLDALARHGVVLKSIQPAGDLEDAFLKTLQEDRRKGFARALDTEDIMAQLGIYSPSRAPRDELPSLRSASSDEVI